MSTNGTLTPDLDSLFTILAVVGIVEDVVEAANPCNSDVTQVRIDEALKAGGAL